VINDGGSNTLKQVNLALLFPKELSAAGTFVWRKNMIGFNKFIDTPL
jgi:hypothetical protein